MPLPTRTEPNPALPDLYDSGFFREIEGAAIASARVAVPIVIELLKPASVIDLGCGTGAWLSVFRELGVARIRGVDGSWVDRQELLVPEDAFITSDFREMPAVNGQFDLAMSVEVAEHLDPRSGDQLVDALTSLAPAVMFSAGIPRQGGVHHINEQWPSYWMERFAARGYDAVDCLRPRLWGNPDVAGYYAQNLMLYVRRGHLDLRLQRGPSDIVHPELWNNVHQRCEDAEARAAELERYCDSLRNFSPGSVSLKAALTAIPSLALHALRRRIEK